MSKKIYWAIIILIILLYAVLILSSPQMAILGGELLGYISIAMIIAGIIAVIWLLVKPRKKDAS